MNKTAATKYGRNSIAVVEIVLEVWPHPQADNLDLVVVGKNDPEGLHGIVTVAPKGWFLVGEKVAWFLPGACIEENEAKRMGVWKYLDHQTKFKHRSYEVVRYGVVGVRTIRWWKSHGFVHTLSGSLRNLKPGDSISQFYDVWEEYPMSAEDADIVRNRPYYVSEDGEIHEVKYNVDGCFHWNLLDGDDEFDIEYPKDTLASFIRLGTLCPNLASIASDPLTAWQEEYIQTLDALAGDTMRKEYQIGLFTDPSLGEPHENRSGNLYTPPADESIESRINKWLLNDEQQEWVDKMVDEIIEDEIEDNIEDNIGDDGMNTDGLTRDGVFYVRDTEKMTPEEIEEWMDACGSSNRMYVFEEDDHGCGNSPSRLRRFFKVLAGMAKGFIAAWVIMILFPVILGFLSFSTNFGGKADQEWLDRAQFRIYRLILECKDPEVKKVLEYAHTFKEIGPFSVAVTKCNWAPCKKDMYIAGINSPLCPGMSIDVKTTTDPIDEGALVIIHESLHDYFPYYGHDHVNPVMEKVEALNQQITRKDDLSGYRSWEFRKQ